MYIYNFCVCVRAQVCNRIFTSLFYPSQSQENRENRETASLRKQTRHNGRMIYADINTPIAARYLSTFLLLSFRADRAVDTSLGRSQRNRVVPAGRRNITPL